MIKDFLIYFFGQGTEPEFAIFTAAHIIPILLLFLAIFLLYRYRDTIRESSLELNFRYILAFALIICDMSYYWRLAACPWLSNGPSEHLPIGVCAWSVIFCSFMLIGKSQRLFDIVYFWILGCSVFALLTPTPLTFCGPTRFRYYQFWLEHTLTYIAVFLYDFYSPYETGVPLFCALFCCPDCNGNICSVGKLYDTWGKLSVYGTPGKRTVNSGYFTTKLRFKNYGYDDCHHSAVWSGISAMVS